MENILGEVISNLSSSKLYQSDEAMEVSGAICQEVWSVQSVENLIRDMVLPYLRTAAMLLFHLYGDVLPMVQVGGMLHDLIFEEIMINMV